MNRTLSLSFIALLTLVGGFFMVSCKERGSGTASQAPSTASLAPDATAKLSLESPAASASSSAKASPGKASTGTASASPSGLAQASVSPVASAAPASAKPSRKMGEIVSLTGKVSIQRAGGAIEKADIGSVLRSFDILSTGPKSKAEVDLASGVAGGSSIKLAENTVFYFDTKILDTGDRKTALQLLSGSLAIKVDKLLDGSFSVGTDQAVAGVRGTIFILDTVPDGSLLVTCNDGAVAVSAGGRSVVAKPGVAVEMPEAAAPRTVSVNESALAGYRNGWREEAYKSFGPKALSYASQYAATLTLGQPKLEAAIAKLQTQKTTLDAWRKAKAEGKVPRFTDYIAEKKAVAAVLFDCLKALFELERPYYRLFELKALHETGTGVGTLKDGRASADFYQGLESSTKDLSIKLAQVREALLLFSWVAGDSPMGDFFGSKAESLGTGSLFLGE